MHDAVAIARTLREIARLLEIRGESIFRVRAYQQASVTVQARAEELPKRLDDGTLEELDYIGPTTARLIRELWETGHSDYLDRLRDEIPAGVVQLAGTPGVGPRRAMTLFRVLGVDSPEALLEACRLHRVTGLHGFGEKTEARLREAAERTLQASRPRPPTPEQLSLPDGGF